MSAQNPTPAAAQLAREAGIRLHGIRGTGASGRVVKSDVERHIATLAQSGLVAQFQEAGRVLPEAYWGQFNLAHTSELNWPSVFNIYSRIRRTDPEVAIVRQMFTALVRSSSFEFQPGGDDPGDMEKDAADFANEVLLDLDRPFTDSMQTVIGAVPFYGWGWFELVPGLRMDGWSSPDPEDDWESKFSDGRIGFRRLAWRDQSTFVEWDLTERSQRLKGMVQLAGGPESARSGLAPGADQVCARVYSGDRL